MPSAAPWIATLMRRFAAAAEGVAAVEFALIVPLLLTLYLGSVEASSLYTVDRRVTVISGAVGDLIARWNPDDGSIPQSTIDDYFTAAEVIMTPYDATGLQQVVSLLWINSTGTTKVLWSKATGGATPRATNSTYPLAATTQMNVVARGTSGGWLVVSEALFPYKPVMGLVFQSALDLDHTSFFLPRFDECITVVTGGKTSACS